MSSTSWPHFSIKDDGQYEARRPAGPQSDRVPLDGSAIGGASAPRRSQGIAPNSGCSSRCRWICRASNYHVLAEVNIDPGAEPATLDLQVDPGRSLTLRSSIPRASRSAGRSRRVSASLFPSTEYPKESPTFEIPALDPEKPRRVTINHEGRRADRLGLPQGGRDRTDDRRAPALGYDHRPDCRRRRVAPQRPGSAVTAARFRIGPTCGGSCLVIPGPMASRSEETAGSGSKDWSPTSATGRTLRRATGTSATVFKDLTVAPGEARDLGDLKVQPPKKTQED